MCTPADTVWHTTIVAVDQEVVPHVVTPTPTLGVPSPAPKFVPYTVIEVPAETAPFSVVTWLTAGESYVKPMFIVPDSFAESTNGLRLLPVPSAVLHLTVVIVRYCVAAHDELPMPAVAL
jgi:hypothetical protein